MANLLIVHNKVHKPKGCTLAYRCRLSRLKMGKAEARHILVFICKLCNACNSVNKLLFDKKKCFTHCDNIRIITYITTCCTEVNNRLSLWALLTVSVNMAHNIMSEFLFIFLGNIIIDIVGICFKLVNLVLSNIKTEFFFSLGKSYPKFSPSFKLKIRRIDILHFL